jgi:hypothetical protein
MKLYTSIPAFILGALLSSTGCGGSGGGSEPTGGNGGSGVGSSGEGGSGGTGGTAPAGPWDSAGIRGCAKEFVESDGLCHPRAEKCADGTIAKLDEGCVPVGVVGCAKELLGEDGVCHASSAACPEGTFAIPSEGCVPIDGAEGCGAGTWGSIADGANTIWVDPAYAGIDGDGSKAKPVKTIAAALALAPEGGRVALAAGDYAEPILPTKAVEVVGRCPSMVKITGTGLLSAYPAAVGVGDVTGEVIVRRIQVTGVDGTGLRVRTTKGAKVTFDQVWVHDIVRTLLNVGGPGAQVTAHHVYMSDTHPKGDNIYGAGAEVVKGAELTLDASAVVRSHVHGVMASDNGTKLTMKNSLVAETKTNIPVAHDAIGVLVIGQSVANLEGIVSTGNRVAALHAGDYSDVTVKNSVLERTLEDEVDNDIGYGVQTIGEGTLRIESSVIQENTGGNLVILGAGREVTLDRCLVKGAKPKPNDMKQGGGIYVTQAGELQLENSTLIDNLGSALQVSTDDSKVEASRSLFQGTKIDLANGIDGHGALAFNGGAATFTDCAFIENQNSGAAAGGSGSAITLDHSLIQGNPSLPPAFGYGVSGADAVSVTVTSSAILGSRLAGIILVGGNGTITDSIVREVKEGKAKNGATVGDGILVLAGDGEASVAVSGSLVEQCDRAGILLTSGNGKLSGSKVTKNQYGLVIQGAKAEVDGDSEISGNSVRDRDDAGALPLP